MDLRVGLLVIVIIDLVYAGKNPGGISGTTEVQKNDNCRSWLGGLGKYTDLGGQLLYRLSKSKNNDEKVNALSDTITETIQLNLQESSAMPPMEINIFGNYACGGHGLVSDLTTIRHVQTKVCQKADYYEISVVYSFDKLKFTYKKFYLKVLGMVKLDGEMNFRFKENQIEVVIGVSSLNTLVSKISSNIINPSVENCFIRIADLNALILKYDSHDLLANSRYRRSFFSSQLDSHFKSHEDELRQQFESQTLQEVYRILTEEKTLGTWVCNDEELKKLIERKGGSVELHERSSSFKRHCA